MFELNHNQMDNATNLPKPRVKDGAICLTIHIDVETKQVGTAWEPLKRGAFVLAQVYLCPRCGRLYSTYGIASGCSQVICKEGVK